MFDLTTIQLRNRQSILNYNMSRHRPDLKFSFAETIAYTKQKAELYQQTPIEHLDDVSEKQAQRRKL